MDRGPGPGVRRGGGGEERSGEGELQVPEDLGAAGGSKGLRLRLRGRKGKDAIEEDRKASCRERVLVTV